MEYYERVATASLADDFYQELRRLMQVAAARPESFSIRQNGLRRANLQRFPYHFLYRIADDTVRVLVVRHNRRHPSAGTHRE